MACSSDITKKEAKILSLLIYLNMTVKILASAFERMADHTFIDFMCLYVF